LRFAVIGDYGLAGQGESDVASRVASWSPDLILTVGDNNYPSGSQPTIDANIGQYYQAFICPYNGAYGSGASANRFFPALGNHDWVATGAQPYLDFFSLPGNERYYDFVQGPVHFYVIDSDAQETDGIAEGSVQATWLQGMLVASTSIWDIVLFHHAPYSSGPHGSTTALQWHFQQWGADAVIAGHDHTYERIVVNGFPYFVNGVGGSSRYAFGTPVEGSVRRYNSDFGAMLVDATDSNLVFQFITRTGVVEDTFELPASTISGNAGVGGATLRYTDVSQASVRADASGTYAVTVPYNWSGTVTPFKTGYSFAPVWHSYTDVTANYVNQDFTAGPILFGDVPVAGKEWMQPWIEQFYYSGITTGCAASPLRYCPENPVTRAAMAVFILRAEHGPSYVPPEASHFFSDLPVAGKEWMEPWVDQYYREGLTTGCELNPLRYCPENPVTRAAMAVFLLRALEGPSYVPPVATHTFSDMPVAGKEWMEPFVDEFYRRGITTGCGASPLTYCPENSVTRASMAVFIERAYGMMP